MRTRFLTLLTVALASGGCYSYVPMDVSELQPTKRVRLQLTEAEVSRFLDFADARSATISGDLESVGPDSVTVVLQTPLAYREAMIPRSAVRSSWERELNKRNTFIFSAAAVAAVGVAAYLGFEGKTNFPPGEGGEPPEARIPLFRFTLPFGGR